MVDRDAPNTSLNSRGDASNMRHAVAALGLLSWDRFILTDHYPGRGEYAIVRQRLEQAGGTTGNTCAALGNLGIPVMVVSRVGDDAEGQALLKSLADAGCDTRHVSRVAGSASDSGIIVVSGAPGHRDRTIFWVQGAKPQAGMTFPVDDILDHEWVLLDVDDPRLRSFFLDLPAHRSPRTRLIGTMTYLVEMEQGEGWKQALRHDVVVGNVRELQHLTATATVEEAVEVARDALRSSACRVMYVSQGPQGGMAIRTSGVITSPAFDVPIIDTTGAGDAFAAGCIWGLLDHLDDADILRRANALGGLACRALGARVALPSRHEVACLLELEPSRS
jgi:sugar/nucleoside kinase (ribokinase family)